MQEDNKGSMLAIVVVIIVIIVGLAIFLLSQNNSQNNVTTNPPVSNATDDTLTYKLNAQNDSGQNGTVTLEENGSTTKVSIFLDEPSGSNEPAHIHLGSCPTPGGVKYPLTNVIDGTSITNINAKISDLKALGPLAVNVHKSVDAIDTYVSCGDLNF